MTESEHRVARDAALLDMDACVTRARPSGPPTHTLPARRGPVQRRADPGAVPRDSQSHCLVRFGDRDRSPIRLRCWEGCGAERGSAPPCSSKARSPGQ